MRLRISKSKNVKIFYVIKTIYVDGHQKTKTVEILGTEKEILKKSNGLSAEEWALSTNGWHTINSNTTINLEDIDNSSSNETVYYKER